MTSDSKASSSVVTFELLGLAVAIVLCLASLVLPNPTKDLVVGLAASFMFGGALLILQRIHRAMTDRDPERFFGSEMKENGITLAYPDFVLAPEVKPLLAGHDQQLLYSKPTSHFSNNHRIDLPRAVATNDLQALVYMTSLFESVGYAAMDVRVDSTVVTHCDRSFVSVGLSSNDCTHLYLRTADQPMFNLAREDGEPEYVVIADGKAFRSTPEVEWGLVVRYSPEPTSHPQRKWFYVAGVGAQATIGSAWFLHQHWRVLLKEAGGSDFVAVISVPSCSPKRSRLEHMYTDIQDSE